MNARSMMVNTLLAASIAVTVAISPASAED